MEDDLLKLQNEVKALQEEQREMGERLKVVYEWLTHIDKRLPQRIALPPAAKGDPPAGEVPAIVTAPMEPGKDTTPDLEAKIGGIWLNRIGILVFLLGAAFFLKLAYDQGWISETVRIIIGVIAAFALLCLGERNRRRGFTAFAQGLTGGGIALLYFTIFASFYYYNLISDTIGIGLLILVTTGAVLLAIYQDARAVALIGLLTGFLNPALFVAGEPRFALMMIYLILLNLGLTAIVYFKGWKITGLLSFIFTNVFLAWTLLYRFNHPATGLPAVAAQIYFSIFLLIFLAPSLLHLSVRRSCLNAAALFLMVAGAATYYGLSWLNLHSDYPGTMGWLTLALAAFYLLTGCAALPTAQRDPRAYFTAFALAALFLVIFVPLQLEGVWIFVGWALLAALLGFLGPRLADRRILPGFWIVLFLALARLISTEWFPFHRESFRFLIGRPALLTYAFIALLLLLSRFFYRYRKEGNLPPEVTVLAGAAGSLLLLFWSLEIYRYGEVWAWHTGEMEYYRNMAQMAVSLLWGLYAAALIIAGFIRRLPPLRYAAIGLFGLTIAKVILFDLGSLELAYRIITLVASGLILLGASYIYQRHRDHVNPAVQQPPEKRDP